MNDSTSKCPCTSGKSYQDCCKPLHDGKPADNAPQLMRSRYSAFALNLPNYIIATTHPANPQYSNDKFSWRRELSRFSKECSFTGLEILDFQDWGGPLATVTFTAHVEREHQDMTFTEASLFEKRGGRWLYRGGRLADGHAPELVAAGQWRLQPLAYYGEPILRKKADPIINIDDDLRQFVQEMISSLEGYNGIGLAAPQVHHSIRLFLVQAPLEENGERVGRGEVQVFINPELSDPSTETCVIPEGCLSIPGLRWDVERPKEITVNYMQLDGKLLEKRFSGWESRIIQHENDHIEGVLFIDHLSRADRKKVTPFLESLERRLKEGLDM